jgi:hypothetical protein
LVKKFPHHRRKRCRIWNKQAPEQPSDTEKTTSNCEVGSEVVQAETSMPSGVENQTQQVHHLELPLIPKKDLFSPTDNGVTTTPSAGTEKSESFGEFSAQVDRNPKTPPQQGFQTDQPDNYEVDPIQKTRLEATNSSTNAELVAFIRMARSPKTILSCQRYPSHPPRCLL